MMQEEFDRSVIEGATAAVTDDLWPLIQKAPIRFRQLLVQRIQEIVTEEYRKMHVVQAN